MTPEEIEEAEWYLEHQNEIYDEPLPLYPDQPEETMTETEWRQPQSI